ncbi:MAG: rRNA ((1402)-2-O)-methyltransferase [Pseudomonadota bacterium]|jgi:16S rRNA (cytidine1402-2'-O)-methyltransferase
MQAVEEAAAHQQYPQGALYMVATPIGNLADIGLRALHVLGLADTVACEDTRHTGSLLQAYGLHKPLLALHEHNENQAAVSVVERLQAGQRVAYVSDAGTPGISDPGARLVQAVQAAGLRTVPIPGASSVTALLSATGHSGWDGRFVFAGFLSPKATERLREVRALATDPRACVLLEAPHRMVALSNDLAILGEREITVGRELTKQFEDIARLAAAHLPAWLQADPHRLRGEFVLVVHPEAASAPAEGLDAEALRILGLLLAELPLKTAVKVCADISGLSRNALYEAALALRQSNANP